MQTPDLVNKNIGQISSLFPNVITEIKDKDGAIKKVVDFDLLRQSLSDLLVEDDNERYRLDWPGKKASLLKANTPINKTLRPVVEDSVDFENTENLYIEGDNFEILKILQESYLGKIKMIYIDPPYNTGNDFIYKDNYSISKEEYDEEIGVENEEGEKLFRNTDSNGRFHSDWLSMIYERLIIARDLLKEDGLIFVSIDDNEVDNLKSLLNELFSEDNFISQIIWRNKYGAGAPTKGFIGVHEYILCYSKTTISSIEAPLDEDAIKDYKNKDDKFPLRGGFVTQPLAAGGKTGERPNCRYPIEYKGKSIWPKNHWIWSRDRFNKAYNNNEIVINEKNGNYSVRFKQYLKDEYGNIRKGKPLSLLNGPFTQEGSKEIELLFGSKVFDFPKPSNLLKYFFSFIINEVEDNEFTVLDFFAGSGTSAHAIMNLNKEANKKIKFILIQLPEKTDENSEAYKAGYKTISEIGKERIRRAGKKIMNELEEKNKQLELGEESIDIDKLDIGFRVYKTDSSNMKDVFYHPSELKQDQLSILESNIKEDRTPEDILTQVILDLGLELSLPIEKKTILDNTVFIVQQNALVACFDDDINFKIVDEIAELKPFKVVFKDASFKDDKDRINIEERFKRLSPETVVTVL